MLAGRARLGESFDPIRLQLDLFRFGSHPDPYPLFGSLVSRSSFPTMVIDCVRPCTSIPTP